MTGNVTLPDEDMVLSGTTFGVSNAELGQVLDCSANERDGCFLNPSKVFKSADLTELDASVIKLGATIAGIPGSYTGPLKPGNNLVATMAAYLLPNVKHIKSPTPDLDSWNIETFYIPYY